MKPYKSGMILGKFMPLHSGHIYMIEQAMKQCEKLTILVCSLKCQVIPGYMRYTWMKNTFPDANVIHVTDEVPEQPENCDEGNEAFWRIWTDLIVKNTPKDLDVVFASEDYGDEIGRRLNIKSVIVDKMRIVTPISATMIRNQPFDNWDMIPQEVRHYYVKKVVIVGPESTGKTTLSANLAKHYNTVWVPEYGREYCDNIHRHFDLMDINFIAAGQLYLEDEYAKTANRLLICDTDTMTTQTWSEYYFKTCPPWIAKVSWQAKYDLHLLMSPDVPWINDGQREFSDPVARRAHYLMIKKELDARKWKYLVIAGDSYEERTQNAIGAIDGMLAGVI